MYSSSNVPVVTTLIELPSLVDNLLLLLSDKEKTVIKKRFGLNGKGKFTLESIGREFSVTRERVRQIENHSLATIRKSKVYKDSEPIFTELKELILGLGGLALSRIPRISE